MYLGTGTVYWYDGQCRLGPGRSGPSSIILLLNVRIEAACQHHSVDPSSWQCLALTISSNIPLVLRIKPHFRIRTRVRCPGSPDPWSRSNYTHQSAAPDSLAFEYTTTLGLKMCLPRRKLSAHELHDDALSPSAVKSHAFVSPTIQSDPLDSG